MSLLEVNGLSLVFGNKSADTVVEDLSFTLQEGETLGIVGESGSGKSLTGLSIIGLLPSDAQTTGEILFYDGNRVIDLLTLTEKEKRNLRGNQISMIFQEPMTALNPVMRCGRQVEEILKIHGKLSLHQRKEKVIELFHEVMLVQPQVVYTKYPHQLSGGQRQRVMIAMAIACNPKILIADEPTTALDVTVQKGILDLLNSLKQKHNLSVVFISHDLNIISKISDKILVLYRGKGIEYGLSDEILNHPREPYTKGLLSCRPKKDIRLRHLPTISDYLSNPLFQASSCISSKERETNQLNLYSKSPMLRIQNLQTYFSQSNGLLRGLRSSVQILKNIDFQLWEGETVGLVGESGSGKTTLGRTLMQLIENFTGEIIYQGENVSHFKNKKLLLFRKNVQLIFQDPYGSLNPNHTIGNAILEPLLVHQLYSSHRLRKERVLELMRLTGLEEDWFNRYPHQLSGGQRQRVVIARALAVEPKILICDESVSALDVSIQAQILNLLNDLKHQLGLTYIFISHDLAVVKFMADRIFVMKNGQILEQNEADALCGNPKDPYTQLLLKAAFDA
jgi:peptide/nickel transport system ATP-binding protein